MQKQAKKSSKSVMIYFYLSGKRSGSVGNQKTHFYESLSFESIDVKLKLTCPVTGLLIRMRVIYNHAD